MEILKALGNKKFVFTTTSGSNWVLQDKMVFTRKEENLLNISETLWKHIRKGPDDVQVESSLSWVDLSQMWFKLRLGGCTEI